MSRIVIPAAAAAIGLVVGAAPGTAQGAAALRTPAAPWVVSPADAGCRTELELTGRSGAITPVTLTSDGQIVSLRFAKADLPERAFLPIRVDRARFSNLMLRGSDGTTGELVLSEETEAALRKGATLDVAWLADEPLSVSLAGSEQGLSDLRVCGAQAAVQARARQAAEAEARARADQDARERAVAEAQVEAARAQAAAADAERQRVQAEADRARRQEEAERQRLYAEAERRRAYEAAERRRAWEEEQAAYYRPPPQPYYPPPAVWRRGW